MYISDLFIKNFQSHKETYLQLSPGVNAFIGDTDSGKSAVFRALIWLFTNKPNGEEFRSLWGGTTEVSVCLQPQNLWIGRTRGKNDNYYWVGDDLPENRHSGFGNGPPPQEIIDILNMGEVNFQAQMTLPFLLSLGASKVGKFFNESADLEIIDSTFSNLDRAERSDRAQRDSAKGDNEVKEEQLRKFAWLDEAEAQLSQCEKEHAEIKSTTTTRNTLGSIADDIEEAEEKIDQIAPVLKAGEAVDDCFVLLTEIETKNKTLGAIKRAVEEIRNTETLGEELSKTLPAETLIKACLGLVKEINDIAKKQTSMMVFKTQIIHNDNDVKAAQKKRNELEERFLNTFPDICPLCDSVLST